MGDKDTREVFRRVQFGDEDAAREVFERYLERLIGLARNRLSEKLARKVDADDIVQSAFRSFFVRARDGQFAIERAGDLWSLLATITRCKLLKKAEHFQQQKRSLAREEQLQPTTPFAERPDTPSEPGIEEAVALSDELETLMHGLDPLERQMLEMRLQGQPIPDVANAVDRAERTVRRFLGRFRTDLEERLQTLRDG